MSAQLPSIKITDLDVGLYKPTDPYRYDIDNRPLRVLIENDIALKAVLDAVSTEVYNARIDNSSSQPLEYSSLDARLEALTSAGLSTSSVSYSIFQASAERNRALYQSGWIHRPTTFEFDSRKNGFAGDDFGALGGSTSFGFNEPNTLVINPEYDNIYQPIPVLVNGWLVKLFWMNAGGNAGANSTSYPYITVKLPPPPAPGNNSQDFVFLEVWLKKIDQNAPVFWLYGSPQYRAAAQGEGNSGPDAKCTTSDPLDPAYNIGTWTDNPLDPRVVHTLARLNDGSWLQVQHRIRIAQGVDASTVDGFTGTTNQAVVLAQGPQAAPVTGRSFEHMLGKLGDAGLFRAGNGSADITAGLQTFDGYTYAIPITTVHRRNTGVFTMQDQNGSAKAGVAGSGLRASGVSGRPDGMYCDVIDRRDYLDQRHWASVGNTDLNRLMEEAFADVLRGTGRLQWEKLNYTTDPAGALGIYGNRLLTNDTIFNPAYYAINGSSEMFNSNWMIDKKNSLVAYSRPDGVRRTYKSTEGNFDVQRTEFWIDPFQNDAAVQSQYGSTAAGFISITRPGNGTAVVTIDPGVLSSGSGGAINTSIGQYYDDVLKQYVEPVWHWQTDNKSIRTVITGHPTNPNGRVFTFDLEGRTNEKVLVNIPLRYPTGAGLKDLPTEVIRQDYFDGVNTVSSTSANINRPYGIAKSADGSTVYATNYEEATVEVYTFLANGEFSKQTQYTVPSYMLNGYGPTAIAASGNPLSGGSLWVYQKDTGILRCFTYSGGGWVLTHAAAAFVLNGVERPFYDNIYGMTGAVNLAVTPDGATLFASIEIRNIIIKIDTASFPAPGGSSPVATLVAGDGSYYPYFLAYESSAYGAVAFNRPLGISVDPDTSAGIKLWVADSGNRRVLRITTTSAATCTVEVEGKNADQSGGAISARLSNIRNVIALNDGNFLVSAGTSVAGQDAGSLVYKLDANLNIIAQSEVEWNTIAGIAVDSTSAPAYIYVARGGSEPNATMFPEIRVLNYAHEYDSTLRTWVMRTSVRTDGRSALYTQRVAAWDPTALNGNFKYMLDLRYANNGSQSYLFFTCFDNGSGHTWFTPVNGNVVGNNPTEIAATAAVPDQYCTYLTDCKIIGGTPTMYSVAEKLSGGGTGELYSITWNGATWVRSASLLSFGQIPWGVSLDQNDNVYVTFPIDANWNPSFPNGGNVVRRYAAGTYALTGTFGTGVAGGQINQVACPLAATYRAGFIIVAAHKSLAFGVSSDQSRLIFLKTDDASWAAQTEFDHDTNNNAMISVKLNSPYAVVSNGVDELYIAEGGNHVVHKLKRAVTADSQTYQYVGKFGVDGESGNDHGLLNKPHSLVITAPFIVIANTFGDRLLRVHPKMAGVSLATGNVETMTPLLPVERLRVWSNTVSYQGIGSKVLADSDNEYVWSKQVIVESPYLYVTSLGRAPLVYNTYIGNSNSDYRGCITRLPLAGKTTGVDDSYFLGDLLRTEAMDDQHASGIIKLPTQTIGFGPFTAYSDAITEGTFIAEIRTESGYAARVNRGFNADNDVAGTSFSEADNVHSVTNMYRGGDWVAISRWVPKRLVVKPYLIRRGGKVLLAIITSIPDSGWSAGNETGKAGQGTLTAIDFFEVPGRLLIR